MSFRESACSRLLCVAEYTELLGSNYLIGCLDLQLTLVPGFSEPFDNTRQTGQKYMQSVWTKEESEIFPTNFTPNWKFFCEISRQTGENSGKISRLLFHVPVFSWFFSHPIFNQVLNPVFLFSQKNLGKRNFSDKFHAKLDIFLWNFTPNWTKFGLSFAPPFFMIFFAPYFQPSLEPFFSVSLVFKEV